MSTDELEALRDLAKPLVEHLRENYPQGTTAVVTDASAVIVETSGGVSFPVTESVARNGCDEEWDALMDEEMPTLSNPDAERVKLRFTSMQIAAIVMGIASLIISIISIAGRI